MGSEIKDLCKYISSGGTPSRKHEEYYKGGTINWIKTKELNDCKIYESEEKITEKGLRESSAKIFPINTVVMAMYGATAGKLGIMKKESATNQACCNMVVDENKCDYRFLFYSLLYHRDKLINLAIGAAQQNLNVGLISNFEIEIPPLPEQQKIASILSAFDDKIELNNEMNKTLEEIAQAIFKHWFIDFEFPNENGEPYKSSGGEFIDSELGPIPKGWKVVNLREILDNICDSVKPGKEIEGLPYVPIDIIERKSIALKQFKSWEEAQSSLIKFKKDDILLGAMRVYFHKVSIAPCEGVTRKTCFVLRPKKRFDLSYTLLLIFQDDTIKFADAHSKGTTMPYAVWDNGLAEMKIALPTEKIRQRFNELLYPIISKIRDCIFENLTLSQLRDTLLPKLISGEIRVM